MSINKGQFTVGRKVETLAVIEWDVSWNTVDGGLPSWAGGGGHIKGTFTGVPRTGTCEIELHDGARNPILVVPAASMQGEAGPDEPPFKTWASWSANGAASDGRAFAFRTAPFNPEDPTSLNIDFAVAETSSVADTQAVKVWSGQIQAVNSDVDGLLAAWISAQGVNAAALKAFVRSLAGKAHAPNAGETVVAWITDHIESEISAAKIGAIAVAALAEWAGGHPGFNPDHAGVA